LQVGSLDSKKSAAPPTPPATPPPVKEAVKPSPAAAAPMPGPAAAEDTEPLDPFGDLVPFGDPTWYQGVCLHCSLQNPALTEF